jgi:hypothetical protein
MYTMLPSCRSLWSSCLAPAAAAAGLAARDGFTALDIFHFL